MEIPKFKPRFSGLRHALGNGNFWLAVSVALTNFAVMLEKPYSLYFYAGTALCAIVGAFLKSSADDGGNHDVK